MLHPGDHVYSGIVPAASITDFEREITDLLQRGEHVVLYGPLGSGKSTLLRKVHQRIEGRCVPCALLDSTACLDDITSALALAYPEVDTETSRRRARGRLWQAADRQRGILIFDHVTKMTTAMIGFLRRLRGGIAGVLLCFDVEKEAHRLQLRGRHFGGAFLRMPPASPQSLYLLFRKECTRRAIPRLPRGAGRQIIESARGRVGWISRCARLISHERYWSNGTLHTALLCVDTEIALQQGRMDFPIAAQVLK